jgi:hypothetical protein
MRDIETQRHEQHEGITRRDHRLSSFGYVVGSEVPRPNAVVTRCSSYRADGFLPLLWSEDKVRNNMVEPRREGVLNTVVSGMREERESIVCL